MDLKEAEKSLIGILIQKPDALADISRIVSRRDFSNGQASAAFGVISEMWRNKEHVDLVSVSAKNIKLAVYLSEASSVIPITSACIQYAAEVAKNARARRIDKELGAIHQQHGQNPQDTLFKLSDLYHREAVSSVKKCGAKDIACRFLKTIENNRNNGFVGIPTGFDFLEDMRIQYQEGHIWTIGGFTSVGKTAVTVEMICRVLPSGVSVLVISTEMTETQIIARILANLTGYNSNLILSGRLDGQAKMRVDKAIERLGEFMLTVHDDLYQLAEIETACRKMEMQGGVDVVVIDYVQNCQVADAKSSYQEQATLAKRLQKLAKDVEANIICLSQVSNSVGRGDTDQLELKGSGEWAAVSDVSVMLKRSKDDDTKLLFGVMKHRHGVKHGNGEGQLLRYENGFTRIVEIDQKAQVKAA